MPNLGGRKKGTHCHKGHEYTLDNTITIKTGKSAGNRLCRICETARVERRRVKAAAELVEKQKRRRESWFL